MKQISVIGCCVCRDLFESDSSNFSFHTDIRFSSPISMLSDPVDFIKADFNNFVNDVKTVGGNWYKKNLINDINKTAFSALEEKHGEYLILDLAEARIPIAKIKWKNKSQNLLVTNSVSFRTHYNENLRFNIFKNTNIEIISPLEYNDLFWDKTIKSFAIQISKIFNEEKIILIKNQLAKLYIDVNGLLHPYFSTTHFNSIMLSEILLHKLNNSFTKYCPNCKIIEIPPYAIGSQKHKWGNHPLHFTNILYQYLLDCIKAIIIDNNYNKINELYLKYSIEFKREYDEARLKTALWHKNKNASFSIEDLLNNYEEYNLLSRRKKAIILFALDKRHFLKNFINLLKK